MNIAVVILCLWVFGAVPAYGQLASQPAAARPAGDTIAPDIPGVVAGGTAVVAIKEGFQGTQGPVALPDGSLIFTEPNASRITRIDKDNEVSTFLENTYSANGLALDSNGRLIAAQRIAGHVGISVIYPAGREALLADNFEGIPADLVVNQKGGVYFTVPSTIAGQPPGSTIPPGPFPPGVYYIAPGGKAAKMADDVETPNGIQLSPDERTLYVNNTRGGEYMLAFDVHPDGSLGSKRNFAKYEGVRQTPAGLSAGADGIAIDSDGRVYAATSVGVQVFSPHGQLLGTIALSRSPQNLAFAGIDKKTLYVVGRGVVYKIQMLAQGFLGRAK